MTYSTKRLGEVCDVVIGGTPHRGISNYWDGGTLPWVSIADLTRNGREISVTKEQITRVGARESNVKLLPKGTLLFSFKLSIGKVAFAGDDLYTNEAIAGLSIKNERELDKEYLFYFLQQLDFSGAQKAVKGATLNKAKINNLEIPVPPIAEQRKIVAKLEKQFAKIDEAARLRAQNQALTAELLPAALHEIFSSAESRGWNEIALDEGLHIQNGYAFKSSEYVDSGLFVMRIGNVQDGRIVLHDPKYISASRADEFRKFELREGDILMSLTGNVGRVGVVRREHVPALLNQRVARIVVLDDKKIDCNYAFYFLRSSQFAEECVAGGHGMAQLNVSTKKIAQVKVPLPSLEEQKAIVKKLDALSEKVRALSDLQSAQAADLKSLKQSILHEAFSN